MTFASFCRIGLYLLLFSLIPSDFLYAWGPLTHIAIAGGVLKLAGTIGIPAIEKILKYRNEFLFGNVYADVILAKNLVEYREHSHNWKTGIKILKKAETPPEVAFAYGYLCHLASDCIAHNYYVPKYLVLSYKKLFMKHTYWEMRYDNIFHESTWKIAIKMPFFVKKPLELLLKHTLVNPLFSFVTHRNLFNGLLFLQGMKRWRKAIEQNSRRNGFLINTRDVELFYNSSVNIVIDFLKNPENSVAITLDPTGRANIKKAKYLRKMLRGRKINPEELDTLARKFVPDI